MAQHKWHKEIKAWADGAEIEWLVNGDWLPKIHEHWNVNLEYRIKPKSNWDKEKEAYYKGEELEYKILGDWHSWNYSFEPHWECNKYTFRIKPQPKEPQYLYVYDTEEGIKLGAAGNAIPVKNLNGRYKLLGAIELKVNDESTNSY